jgi:transcriptional regulator with XRE-family HTH domain
MNTLTAILKSKRVERDLSQQELARRAQVSLATVQNIEAGRGNPALATLTAICEVLGLELAAKPVSLQDQMARLIHIGVPLMEQTGTQVRHYGREQMRQVLNASVSAIERLSTGAREEKAVAAFLWAVKDHYPSLWLRLDEPLHRWLDRRKATALSVKLRRIALSNLSVSL